MIALHHIEKRYQMGEETIYALADVSMTIHDGEYVAVTGPSGSGKSTLMNLIGCLDIADAGQYLLDGLRIEEYSERKLAALRSQKIGFIFQGFHLLPKLSALENVELPLVYQSVKAAERRQRATEALEKVGLAHRLHHKPTELSGGQQQRAAIARALVTRPSLILADEPTGNLDRKTGFEILSLFDDIHRAGNTIVLITHDPAVAARAQRTITMEDGKITEEVRT